MSTETVDIACKLPHGLVLEVGYEVDTKTLSVVRGDKYRSITLKGWNSNNAPGQQPISLLNPEPGVTKGVPKDVWDEWVKTAGRRHPAYLNSLIFVVRRDPASAKDQADAARMLRSGFEALDPTKLPDGMTEAPVRDRGPTRPM